MDADKDKKEQRFAIEQGEDLVRCMQHFVECCRTHKTDTKSPAGLALHVQTALQMGKLAQRENKVARFDHATQTIIL